MSPRRTSTRALLLAAAHVLTATVVLAVVGELLALTIVAVNAFLLLTATAVLGQVWALRARLRDPDGGEDAALAAALVPVVACAAFVAPRLWAGPREPALATLAVLTLLAPVVERAWVRWLPSALPDRPPARAALGGAAPLAAVALAAGAAGSRAGLGVGLVAALGLGGAAFTRAERRRRDAARLAEWIDRVEVRPESVVGVQPPHFRDAGLRAMTRALATRIDQLALEAREDAQARAQIAEARELRTRFMASMGHELRSPLNSIVGFAQLLEGGMEGQLTREQHESVTMIRRSAEDLIHLITDVLDLARLESGRLALRCEWTPSVEILTDAVRQGQGIVEGQDVEIEAELQPGLPPVHVDQQRIVQAVVGLFRHAASSLTRTSIRLRARIGRGPPGPEEHLRVEILDALGAIPQDEVDRIFEAFQEIIEPRGRRVGGLGMSLSLARGLVRLHGGEIWAESAPGMGTVLCVAIPLEE